MNPSYIIERHKHGWLICKPPRVGGVPLTALSECESLFPKGAVIDIAIPHHYIASGKADVVFCIVTPPDRMLWRKEIEAAIAGFDPESRWWAGLDVGTSSASIFAVFCGEGLRWAADNYGKRSVPADADDFGRCSRLLAQFPEWKANLNRVAEAYSDTTWPAIIARWEELEAAPNEKKTEILRSIRK